MLLKKVLFVTALFTIAGAANAQYQPPAYQSTVKINYVREWTPTSPITDADIVPTRPVEEVKTSTGYLDGLGRPLQTVSKQASPNKKDLVSGAVYDQLGRETYKFLPFTSTSTGAGEITDNGSFKLNPFQQQAAFMNAQYSAQGETFYYSQTDFEASPLNRPVKSFAPGNSWVGSRGMGNEKSTQVQYSFNNSNDVVKIFTIPSSQGGLPTETGTYSEGQLQKTTAIDERGVKVVEFKDKEGQVILKKVQEANTVTDGHSGWLCTYYVYDDMNQLRFVLSPLATQKYIAGTAISTLADGLCYKYEYDSRHRMILKKVPDAAEVYMVYDAKDRLVMMQDGNLRTSGKWLVTVYDVLNRPLQTGLLTDASTSFATHQANASVSSTYPSTASNYELLSENYYDNYNWVAGSGTTLSSTIDNTNFNNSSYFITTYNSSPNYALALVANYDIKGMPTGSRVKILGSSPAQYLYSVLFYDEKGRPIQTQTINSSGGKDVATTQYDFSGKPLRSLLQHSKTGTNSQAHTILTKMEYDHLGRVTYVRKKISSNVNSQTITSPEKTILQNSYDELGQLTNKKIGNKPSSTTELENLAYDYNIRGWLLGVNRNYMQQPGSTNYSDKYFGFELGYDKTTTTAANGNLTTAQYNGNIAGSVWKSKGDAVTRKYDYSYDNVNRLTDAIFKQDNGTYASNWDNTTVNFNTTGIDYDANGNILHMNQMGLKINASSPIDQLTYHYYDNSNKLKNVIDGANEAATKLGDFRASALYQQNVPTKTTTTVDYTYDINGNLVKDKNKDIEDVGGADGIVYNFLNLPQQIKVRNNTGGSKGSIEYIYDATGGKQKKIVHETGKPDKATTYIGGFVYEDDVLQLIPHEEGRIRFKPAAGSDPASYAFDYMLKDHLGNVRMVLTDETKQDKYPVATLESTKLTTEQNYYDIQTANVVDKSTATGITDYINDNGIGNNPGDPAFEQSNSTKLYKLNSNTAKTGLGITLKVMAGDKIDVFGKSYYFQNNPGSGSNNTIPILDLLNGFLNTPGAAVTTGAHGAVSGNTINTPGGTAGINSMITDQTTQNNANPLRPRAFINVIFFDEQFKAVNYTISMVGNNSEVKNHFTELQNLTAQKSGFVYIYCSNETPVNVFFDNMQVVHTRSAILEESHFSSFGLVMSGISSKAAGMQVNKRKYKGKELQSEEFSDGSGLEWTDFGARMYDQQIGRWHLPDQLSEMYIETSPYAFVKNNPINNIEIDGRYFEGKDEKRAARIERRAERRAGKLERKADRQERKGNAEAATDLRGRAGELRNSAQDVRDMRNDATTQYKYGSLKSQEAKGLNLVGPSTLSTGTNGRGHGVVTMFTENNMGSKLHEGRHGGQNARGEFNITTGANYGVADEIAAYRAQYSWKGSLSFLDTDLNPTPQQILEAAKKNESPFKNNVTNLNQINANFVNRQVDPGFILIYPPLLRNGSRMALDVWNNN